MSRESDKLRNQDTPMVLGYELDRATLLPIRKAINLRKQGDTGADPIGDGTFRMYPSGDIVTFDERNRRLRQ